MDKKLKAIKLVSNRRFVIPVIVIVVIITIPVIRSVCYSKTDLVMATINNEPVTQREFKQILSKQRSNIYQYFQDQYGVSDSKEFWTSQYGGEIPIEVAKERALNTIIRIKIEQILAKDKGLIKDISYSHFLKELESENEKRKEAVANNRVIYGPVEYSESGYFQYIYSNMVLKVKKQLFEEESDREALIQFYDSTKETYTLKDAIKIQKIAISILNEDGQNNQQVEKKAEERLTRIKDQWSRNGDLDNIISDYAKDDFLTIDCEEVVFDKGYYGSEDSSDRVYEESTSLSVGEISDIIQDKNTFVIFKVLDVQPQGYQPLNEVINHVQGRYIDEKYNALIEMLVKKVDIKIEESVYKNIVMR